MRKCDTPERLMTELDGTELFTRITERLTDEAMSERLPEGNGSYRGHGQHVA